VLRAAKWRHSEPPTLVRPFCLIDYESRELVAFALFSVLGNLEQLDLTDPVLVT